MEEQGECGRLENLLDRGGRAIYRFYSREMRFPIMGKLNFVASDYFPIRANINTACEKNSAPVWHLKLQKKG